MDFERFEACAKAYGAARARWPQRDHALYDRFAESAEGAAVLAEAERTDRFLDAWQETPAASALIDRTAAEAAGGKRRARRPLVWSAAAFAMSAVFGFAIGLAQGPAAPAADPIAMFILGPATLQEVAP